MARRKSDEKTVQVVTETTDTGEVHVHRTVREWHPHAPETLPEIEATIDAWDGGMRSTDRVQQHRILDPERVGAQVDKLTKRVKGSRKVVVQETVTEWVEGPMGSGPVAVEDEDLPAAAPRAGKTESRPKRRFRVLGFVGRKSEKSAKPAKSKKASKEKRVPTTADPDYQPQCAALTDDGAQCRNSSRHGSRYCSSHKGYQPPTAKGLAQRIEGEAWDPRDDLTDHQSVKTADTRPKVRKAKDTKVKVRKATKKKGNKRR